MADVEVQAAVATGDERKKVILFGGSGLLGRQLKINLPNAGFEVLAPTHSDVDITNILEVIEFVTYHMPDVVINCAAYTDVDDCEHKPRLAHEVNAQGAENIAISAEENDIRLIHVSTDYVFSSNDNEKVFSEDDEPCPCNVYGESKAEGEKLVLAACENPTIVRTAWLYGPGGPSFVHSIVRRMVEMRDFGWVKVVDDQFGCPTPTMLVVDVIIHLLKHPEVSGIFHAVTRGWTSRYKFASEISRLLRVYRRDLPLIGEIEACSSKSFICDAKRPKSSILGSDRLETTGYRRFGWESALRMFLLREWDNADVLDKVVKQVSDKPMSVDTGPVIDVDNSNTVMLQ